MVQRLPCSLTHLSVTLVVLFCCSHFQHRDIKWTYRLLKPPDMADMFQCEYETAFLLKTVN